jgi:hypothetical protein
MQSTPQEDEVSSKMNTLADSLGRVRRLEEVRRRDGGSDLACFAPPPANGDAGWCGRPWRRRCEADWQVYLLEKAFRGTGDR